MAETIKLPVIGPTKRTYVYAGGALIAGIVGYAWFSRTRTSPAEEATVLPEDIPQDRQPPPTVVGSEDFDDENVRAIINTNAEWYTAAIDYLVSTGGFDFTFAALALGKFLARRTVTEDEANLIQAAKGAVGEPPQGGPWPIVRAVAPGPSTPPSGIVPNVLTGWHGVRIGSDTASPITLIELARQHARYPNEPNSVEGTKRQILTRNPFLIARKKNSNNSVIPKGWIIVVPTPERTAA